MAARFEQQSETYTYGDSGDLQTEATSTTVFEIGASVSGRWARTVHTVTSDGQPSRSFRATVKPDPGLWRVASAS